MKRRAFLKFSALAGTVMALGGLGISLKPTLARAQLLKLRWAKETTSVCCYCAVGCGLLVHTSKEGQNRAINVEGNPDHPINEGSLCAKGASIWQLTENDSRVLQPMYRAPFSDKWEAVSWDWALDQIADRVKKTRDATFSLKNAKGEVVNRCDGIANVGSAAMDNEECWVYQAFLRSLGLVWIEHQARI
jgi:formate dehydrogenase major subunit